MTKKHIYLFITIAIILIQVLHLSCLKKKKIMIGLMTKLEAGSIVGASEVNASRIFLEERNRNDIEIVPFDDEWDPDEALKAFKKVKQKGIQFLITSHVSNCAVALENEINSARVLTIVAGATTDVLSKKDDYIFRNILDVENEQKFIAEHINSQPIKNVLIVSDLDNNAYTKPALKYFLKYLKKSVSGQIDISISKFTIKDIETKISNLKFDVIYLLIGGYKIASGSIGQLAKKINPRVRIVFTPWMKTSLLLGTLGDSVENSTMASHYPAHGENKKVDDYIDRFKKKFGYSPTYISLNVYSALEVLAAAIDAGNTDPESVKQYILKTKSFTTSFGQLTFDKYGEINSPIYFINDMKKEF